VDQVERTGDFKLGPVKEALGDKVSWSDIRFVISHLTHSNHPGKKTDHREIE